MKTIHPTILKGAVPEKLQSLAKAFEPFYDYSDTTQEAQPDKVAMRLLILNEQSYGN